MWTLHTFSNITAYSSNGWQKDRYPTNHVPYSNVPNPPCRRRNDFGSSNIHLILTSKQRICSQGFIHLILIPITYQHFGKCFIFSVLYKEVFTLYSCETIKAPAKAKFSIFLRLQAERFTRCTKSKISLYSPFLSRSSRIDCTALSPTPLMAPSPKRISPFTIHRKLQITFIHIRSLGHDTSRLTLVHQFSNFRDIRNIPAHRSRHIFRRIVCFQKSCLISHPRLTSSMRFIECIRSELFPVRPNLLKYFGIMTVLPSAFNKLRLHMV